ncbi:MAG TPA: hypothetical protein VM052_08315 [Candidatus Limnocylindrales bacterium]|nr:hypothetical protein [Candidatus Limnocylindrales bacterium]
MSALVSLALGVAVTAALLAVLPTTPPISPRTLGAPVIASLMRRISRGRDAAAAGACALEILQATAAALRSGQPIAEAVRGSLQSLPRVATAPYERALRAFDLNAGFDAELQEAARSCGDARVRVALDTFALVAAEQLPAARAAAVVASAADRLAFDTRLSDEIRARTSGVRAQIVLLALLVPALALYLVASMPGLAATLSSPLGTFVLVPAAAIFEIAGIVASRAIIRSIAL